MNSTTGEFGRILRTFRLAAGLSQEGLALAAGLSVRAVRNLERGRTKGPQLHTVEALTRSLGLSPEEALGLEAAAVPGRQRERPDRGPDAPRDRSIPRALADFTARDNALARLDTLCEAQGPAPVVVVSGVPGLGKTAFAVHAAHRLAPSFLDGCLHLDLRGMDSRPVRPAEALARLLRALGVSEQTLPHEEEDRAAMFRSQVAARRLVLVLDNAADEGQVRPLLPGTGACLTLVTSRSSLAGLTAVHRVELPLLRSEEAVQLLTRIIGPLRVAAEAQAARDLADLCGGLPLAVRIAGQRLAARPHESLAKLAARLHREERRLDALQAGDLQVRAAFALSYRQLGLVSRRVLRRCALAAGPDVSPETAALLADVPLRAAESHLEELCDRGLLQAAPSTERYRFHDLLRLFAAEQGALEDPSATREAALDRAARWMLARAASAALRFDAQQRDPLVDDPQPETAPADHAQARAWLTAEQAQWIAALHHAYAAGWYRQVVDTAEAMHWFSDTTHHWEQWVDVFGVAVHAARTLGDRREEATQLNYLAWAHGFCTHDHQAAFETAVRALDVAHACQDPLQIGWALGYGGGALRRLGRTGEASAWLRDAEACHRGNTSPESWLAWLSTINTLGETLRQQGDAEAAVHWHLRSLTASREPLPDVTPDVLVSYQGITLLHLGRDYAALDRWYDAESTLRQALVAFEAAEIPAYIGPARLELGRALRHLGRLAHARAELLAALDALTEHGNPEQGEAVAELLAVGS